MQYVIINGYIHTHTHTYYYRRGCRCSHSWQGSIRGGGERIIHMLLHGIGESIQLGEGGRGEHAPRLPIQCASALRGHSMIIHLKNWTPNFFLFYQKTIGKKGIGTISKKFRAPEITEADRTKAAIEVLKNTYKGNVMEWWKRLQVHINIICSIYIIMWERRR